MATKAANGILWVAAADPETGHAISEDVLLGDSVVVDVNGSQAYGFGAISFQAGHGFNHERTAAGPVFLRDIDAQRVPGVRTT